MVKKILAILLTTLSILAVSGCSSSALSGSKSSNSTESTGTESSGTKLSGSLNIWAYGAGAEADARKSAIEVFIKKHPELKVTYSIIPVSDNVWDQKSAAALSSGSAADVMQMSPDYYGMNTKYYIDLNPYIKKDNINLNDSVTSGMMDGYYDTDGKLEGMPLHANCFVMAYNKDMFKKAGVPVPKDGWTMEDLADWGKKFASGSGASQTYAIAKHWVIDSLMLYAEGGTPYSKDMKTSNMGSEEIKKSLTLYQKLIGNGIMQTDTAQKTVPAETLFVSGKAAMLPMGGFDTSTVISDAEENGIDIGFCKMPSDSKGKEINVQFATGWAITTTSKNKDAAWQFLKESSFANDEMGEINSKVGIPANKKVAESSYSKQVTGSCQFSNSAYVAALPSSHLNPFGGTLSSSGNLWKSMVEAATLDNQDSDQVIKKYAPQIENEFSHYSFNTKK